MEEQKLKTIEALASLLRETVKKELVINNTGEDIETVYSNSIFTEEEHALVKKKFLHLISTL